MRDENSSSSSSSAIVSTPVSLATTVISSCFNHPQSIVLTVKLDENNYLSWRGMVLAILRGQKVDGYVLGTKVQPSEFIGTSTETNKKLDPNPLFYEWNIVNQALSGWLFSSMTLAIAANVVSFKTSREVWKALEKVYGATRRAKVNQLRGVLQNTKKGSMKMAEYLDIMKQAYENLQLAGNPISLDDLILYVLAGLDSEYILIVCSIEDKDITTWQELALFRLHLRMDFSSTYRNY